MSDDDATEFEDFICTCDQPRKDAAAALRAEVVHRLAEGTEEGGTSPVTDANFTSAVVWSLNWDHDARITQIASDQWFGVWAESYDGKFKTRIECDSVEDGLAATWRAFADRPSPVKFNRAG